MSNEIIKKTELNNSNINKDDKLDKINKINQDGSLTDANILELLNLPDEEFNKEILKHCNDIIKQIEEFKNNIK